MYVDVGSYRVTPNRATMKTLGSTTNDSVLSLHTLAIVKREGIPQAHCFKEQMVMCAKI